MIWAFVVISVVFVVILAYLGNRIIRVLEAIVNVLNKRQSSSSHSVPSQAKEPAARTVEELPPEVIAPNLLNPPRPRGGIGTAVRADDDLQVQSANGGEEGNEGGQISGPTSDPTNYELETNRGAATKRTRKT